MFDLTSKWCTMFVSSRWDGRAAPAVLGAQLDGYRWDIATATPWLLTSPYSMQVPASEAPMKNLRNRAFKRRASTALTNFTIDDPSAFTQPWTARLPWPSAPGPLYEYIADEGKIHSISSMPKNARQGRCHTNSGPPTIASGIEMSRPMLMPIDLIVAGPDDVIVGRLQNTS